MLEIWFNVIASRLGVAGVFNIKKVVRPRNFLNSLLQRSEDLLSTTAASKLDTMDWFWTLSTPCMENFACGALTVYFYNRCIGQGIKKVSLKTNKRRRQKNSGCPPAWWENIDAPSPQERKPFRGLEYFANLNWLGDCEMKRFTWWRMEQDAHHLSPAICGGFCSILHHVKRFM